MYRLASARPGYPAGVHPLRARLVDDGRDLTYSIPPPLRRIDRFEAPTLIVANGDPARPVTYRIKSR